MVKSQWFSTFRWNKKQAMRNDPYYISKSDPLYLLIGLSVISVLDGGAYSSACFFWTDSICNVSPSWIALRKRQCNSWEQSVAFVWLAWSHEGQCRNMHLKITVILEICKLNFQMTTCLNLTEIVVVFKMRASDFVASGLVFPPKKNQIRDWY